MFPIYPLGIITSALWDCCMNKITQHVREHSTKCLIFSKCLIMYANEKSGENREQDRLTFCISLLGNFTCTGLLVQVQGIPRHGRVNSNHLSHAKAPGQERQTLNRGRRESMVTIYCFCPFCSRCLPLEQCLSLSSTFPGQEVHWGDCPFWSMCNSLLRP